MDAESLSTPWMPGGRDDRPTLKFAFVVAAVLHVAAIFLPLPKAEPLPPPVAVPRDVPRVWTRLPPPRVPDRPAYDRPSAGPPLPFGELETPSLLPHDDPELGPVEAERFDAGSVVDYPSIAAPPAPDPGVYDQATAGLELPALVGDRIRPSYPAVAIRARREATVVLQAVISEHGEVVSIEVLRAPVPDLGFVDAAREAVGRWRYSPGRLQGRRVAVSMSVIVTFELN